MRAVLVLAVLMIWTTFVVGSVAMAVYLAISTFRPAPPVPAAPGTVVTRSRERILTSRLLAFGAIFGAIYGIIVGTGFVRRGDTASFFFAAAPAIAFAILATVTSLRLRAP